MSFRDPHAAYTAGTNVEAHLVCGLLRDAGIEALVIEDHSPVGAWIGGYIPGIHQPQVWIERADAEPAQLIVTEYDRRKAERQSGKPGAPVDVVCEKCGARSTFPAARKGTVQNCPRCRAYVDVGDDEAGAG